MKSVKAQLLVTLAATAVAAGFFTANGLPPRMCLHEAAFRRDLSELRRNINWDIDVNAVRTSVNDSGAALHFVATWGYEDVAELLIANGADVNVRNVVGATPLDLALFVGNQEMVTLLRRHGARE